MAYADDYGIDKSILERLGVPFGGDEVELLMNILEKEDPVYDEVVILKIQELFAYISIEDTTGKFNNFLNTFKQEEDFKCYLTEHYERYDNTISMAKAMN